MSTEKDLALPSQEQHLVKRLLDSMWFYWLFLLAISFGIAAVIYFVWLRGTV